MLNKLKNKHNLIIIVVIFALLIIDQITKIIFFKQGLNIANEVVENQNNNYYILSINYYLLWCDIDFY